MKIRKKRPPKAQTMLFNTLVTTSTSFFLNFCTVYFRLWLAGKIGEEGIGIYQLIISVYSLLATVATSGLSFTVTRTVSETLAKKQTGVKKIMFCCIALGLAMGMLAFSILHFGAEFIATSLIKAPDTTDALRILAFGLPFMSVASCMSGYFIALRKAVFSSAVQITEELSQMLVTILLFIVLTPTNIRDYCKILVAGTAISEFMACALGFFVYKITVSGFPKGKTSFTPKSILAMTLPMSVTGYVKSGLLTLENLTVPISLQKYGMTTSKALSLFGLVKGMVVPVIFFPAIILSSVSKLLMPEISEFRARGMYDEIDRTGSAFITVTYAFSIITGAVFTFFATPLSIAIFGDTSAALTIKLLAPLIPFMYIDSIFDSLLKGLDDQLSVMRYSLFEALTRIGLVFFLIPKAGYTGFIFTIYTGNMVNTCLGIIRFCRKIKPKGLRPYSILGLTIVSGIATYPFALICNKLNSTIATVITIFLAVITFIAITMLLSLIRKGDFEVIKKMLLKHRTEL